MILDWTPEEPSMTTSGIMSNSIIEWTHHGACTLIFDHRYRDGLRDTFNFLQETEKFSVYHGVLADYVSAASLEVVGIGSKTKFGSILCEGVCIPHEKCFIGYQFLLAVVDDDGQVLWDR
jgi:hypothetical protein